MNIILVHGAWHNEHCWDEFLPLLRAEGFAPHVLTLPGHVRAKDEKAAPATSISMDGYGDAVVACAESIGEPVTILGHSMGGYVISRALEKRPELFRLAIYLTALVPQQNGTPLLVSHASELLLDLLGWSVLNPLTACSHFKPGRAAEVLYNRCSEPQQKQAIEQLCPQPIRPLLSPAGWSNERLGSVSKAYIECADDNTLCLDLQRKWQSRMKFDEVVTLDADHSPFLSAKVELAAAICSLIGR